LAESQSAATGSADWAEQGTMKEPPTERIYLTVMGKGRKDLV
jgi:hypothetical protein